MPARARRGVLRQVDGAQQPEGQGDRHRDHRADEERAPEERHRAEAGTRIARVDHLRAPMRAEQEVGRGHAREEAARFP